MFITIRVTYTYSIDYILHLYRNFSPFRITSDHVSPPRVITTYHHHVSLLYSGPLPGEGHSLRATELKDGGQND